MIGAAIFDNAIKVNWITRRKKMQYSITFYLQAINEFKETFNCDFVAR